MRLGLSSVALALGLALACVLTVSLAPLPAAVAAAPPLQGPEQITANANQFLILYPDLRQAPAPAWLRPGVRVSYNFTFATFARSSDDPTPSGASLLQYDVVAQDRRNVVVVPTLYNTQIQGQPPTSLGYQIGLPGVGEFWFAPQVLRRAESAAHDQFLVNRLSVEVEGQSFDVVRLHSITNGGEEVWEFDKQTGVLVFYRQALYDAQGRQTSGSIMSLLGSRQLRLPWRFGSVPGWVQRGTQIDLAGSQALDLGIPPYIPLPMAISVRVDNVGSLWSEYSQTMSLSNRQIASGPGATGVAQMTGGIWLPPEALDVLRSGDILDRDPVTNTVTRVDEASARRIAISVAGPNYLTRYLYDARTGRLTGFYQEAHMAMGVQYTELAAQ